MNHQQNSTILIVGAGQTGGRAALTLRREGFEGRVTLIGNEEYLPYERPPLSKKILTGKSTPQDCQLTQPSDYIDAKIEVVLNQTVKKIHPQESTIEFESGEKEYYDKLLLATGGSPRILKTKGSDLSGIRYLRTLNDATKISENLNPDCKVLVVGGGFIGLEVAASAITRGCDVTLIEAAPQLMGRAVSKEISNIVEMEHRRHGVKIKLNSVISKFIGDNKVEGGQLNDDKEIACDITIIGIGINPNIGLAKRAGILVNDGILTNSKLETSEKNIYAAGDVASFEHPLFGKHIRLEAWKNAEDQATLAAKNMLGANEAINSIPWFWSDQYEYTLQVAGIPQLGKLTIKRNIDDKNILFFYLKADGTLIGASGVGPSGKIGKEVRIAQMLIEKKVQPNLQVLADPSIRLKSLLQ
jgi:3-phenylpropionate/trans-cinnamate dioxygenase ferredoxin reductase subunit